MKIEAVQEERGPRKFKADTNRKPQIECTAIVARVEPTHDEIMTRILIACIKQAKNNDSFQRLDRPQQTQILSHVWCECFVLRASHWTIDINEIIEQCNDRCLQTLINDTRTLNADLIEVSLLETLILCRKGLPFGACIE